MHIQQVPWSIAVVKDAPHVLANSFAFGRARSRVPYDWGSISTNPMGQTNSNTVSDGIRVQAAAQFLPGESDPDRGRFIFVYRIRITNDSERTAQLISRHWIIIDGNGRREDVQGDGVVGKQPILSPGETFEYTSYCPMRTEWGTMEGSFAFVDELGEPFQAAVGRFYMATSAENVILS